ncbi:MAG: hypothetical protein V5A44_00260 [Haloarculaceae archaeon]
MAAASETIGSLTAIGAVSALLVAVGLAVVTLRTAGGAPISAFVGLISGVGAYFLVPYLVRLDRFGQADGGDGGRVNTGALGAALSATGFVILALLLIVGNPVVAAGIGVPLAGLEFVIWSLALPRAATEPGEKKPIHRRG